MGHSGPVASVAFSPDGTRIVSGSYDYTVRLWDTVSGAHLCALWAHFDLVNSVVFSPDGTRIVSGSGDKTVRLWDTVSAHICTLKGHSGWVTSVAFSPDGIRVASGSADRTIRLWDADSGAHLSTLEGISGAVSSVAFSLDGTRIVSGYNNGTVQLWDAVDGVHLGTFHGLPSRWYICYSVAYSLHPQQSSFSESITKHITSSGSSQRVGYIVDKDGWLCSLFPIRRICWVPVSCRPRDLAFRGNHIAFGMDDGRVIILDLQHLQPQDT
jgi:WD40 repeat protein